MSNLSLCRLTDLLNALIEQCSTILPPDASTLGDAAIKQRVEDWFLSNRLTPTLTEAALQCEQHGLVGAAKQMRDYSAELVQRRTDILFNDMARHWTVEESAFYRQKYGPFPMPLANESSNEEIQRDRRMALIGRVHKLGEYARSLVHSIETAANQQAGQQEPSGGAPLADLLTTDELADDAWLSASDIAKRFPTLRVPAVSKRLERWRSSNSDGWREVTDRKPREAQYLYRLGDVKHLFEPSGETSDERRTK